MYRKTVDGKTYSLIGNPNLGEVRGVLVGVQNAKDPHRVLEVLFVQKYGLMNSGYLVSTNRAVGLRLDR